MNTKLLSSVLLTAILLASLALALNFDLSSSDIVLTKAANNTLTITNSGTDALNFSLVSPLTIVDGEGDTAYLKPITPSSFTLGPSNSTTLNIALLKYDSDFALGSFSSNLLINAVNTASQTEQRNLTVTLSSEYCAYGQLGKVRVSSVKDLSSDNDFKWKPLDEVDLEVKVQNDRIGDSVDVVVDADLYDTVNHQFIGLDGNGGTLESTTTLDDGSSDTIDMTAKVPIEAVDSTGRYVLYVKAYEDGNEDVHCNELTKSIEINRETRQIALTDFAGPTTLNCGSADSIDFKVANIGRNDEKRIRVDMTNTELGITQTKEISNLGQSDSPAKVSFPLEIPSNATEKTYTLTFDVYFKYNSNGDSYDLSEKGIAKRTLEVSGNCVKPVVSDAIVTATLESTEAVAGQDIVIRANVKNTGSQAATYTISTSGAESFATVSSIVPQTLVLNAGQSQDVVVTLKANAAASGDYTFNIQTAFNGQVKSQPVSLTVTPKTSVFSGNIFSSFSNNWFIWVVVLVNIILIVLIIVVAIRISRG